MFEDIVQRGKQQARQPFGLTPGQSSELQRAAAIIESVEECCADERLSYALNNILDFLHRVVRRAELARAPGKLSVRDAVIDLPRRTSGRRLSKK